MRLMTAALQKPMICFVKEGFSCPEMPSFGK